MSLEWQIIAPSPTRKSGNRYVWARCPLCKNDREVRLGHIKSGQSRMCLSCSCKNRPSNQLGRMRSRTKKILALLAKGELSSVAIAKKMGCTPANVCAIQKKYIRTGKLKMASTRHKKQSRKLQDAIVDELPFSEVEQKAAPNTLQWAEVFAEWDFLNPIQQELVVSIYGHSGKAAAENYIQYCVDPGFLSLENEVRRVLTLLKNGEDFFAKEVSIALAISLRRAQLILNNLYTQRVVDRKPIGTKGAFSYKIKGQAIAKDNFDLMLQYIQENEKAYRSDLFAHFNHLSIPEIEAALRWVKKQNKVRSLWCLERKEIYYVIEGVQIPVRELHKSLLLQQFTEFGPSTVYGVSRRVNQRESSLKKAVIELIEEGKVEIVETFRRKTVYGLVIR